MPYSDELLSEIYDKTSGYCHLCGKKLAFRNYGNAGSKGAWEVEHSMARANGGSDGLNNLYSACIPCNRDKSTTRTRAARAWFGRTRAPLSRERRKQAKIDNSIAGGIVGFLIGTMTGPGWPVIGAIIAARLGYRANPDGM